MLINSLKVFVLMLLLTGLMSAQQDIRVSKSADNILEVEIVNNFEYEDIQEGAFTIRKYTSSPIIMESGTYRLPYRDIFVALPEGSVIDVAITERTEKSVEKAVPWINRYESEDASDKKTDKTQNPAELYSKVSGTVKPVEILGYFYYRDLYCAKIRVYSAEFNENLSSIKQYGKVNLNVTFETPLTLSPLEIKNDYDVLLQSLVINSEYAESFRTNPNYPAGVMSDEWIDYTKDYVKISVGEDNLYRVYGSDLEAQGVSLSQVDPATLKLHESGEEKEVFVNSGGDNFFDPADYIEFYGQKNYNENYRIPNDTGEEYVPYLNRYTDSTFYFISWGGEQGKRALTNENTPSTGETLDYYNRLQHFEENTMYQPNSVDTWRNQDPEWTETNAWYWKWVNQYAPMTVNFTLPDLKPGKTARFYSKQVSGGAQTVFNAHDIALIVNGTTIDTQTVNRNQVAVLSGEVSSDILSGGGTFVFKNYDNGMTVNFFAYDWYEIEYPRYIKAVNDSLIFGITDEIAPAVRKVVVSDVGTGDFELYKVAPSLKKITEYQYSGSTVEFYDTVSTGSKYILMKNSGIQKPDFLYKKRFVNLRSQQNKGEYIAMSNKVLGQSVVDYVNMVNTNYSAVTKLVYIDDIYDEFAFGYPYAESIREFLKRAYVNWQSPKPVYVNFIGSATYDYKGYVTNNRVNKNIVPAFGEPVSDAWYTVWDEISNAPQMLAGRIPVLNSAELDHYHEKHLEQLNAGHNVWNKRALLFSGGQAPAEYGVMKAYNVYINDNIITTPPLSLKSALFYKTDDPPTSFGPYPDEYIENEIDKGGIIINYIGHSGTEIWDNSVEEVEQLQNMFGKHPLITDFGCSTGKFGEPDIFCFGTQFTNEGSSIVYIGNSSLGSTMAAQYASRYFYNALLKDTTETYRVSAAHLKGRLQFGNYTFTLANVLLGDPIVKLPLPKKVNFEIPSPEMVLREATPNDQQQHVEVMIPLYNTGVFADDTVKLVVEDFHQGNLVFTDTLENPVPEFVDSVVVQIPVKNLAGNHEITVKADFDGAFDEISESDNSGVISFNVASNKLRYLVSNDLNQAYSSKIRLINPAGLKENFQIKNEIATNPDFEGLTETTTQPDSFYSDIILPSGSIGERFWMRSRISGDTNRTTPVSYIKEAQRHRFYLGDSIGFARQEKQSLAYTNDSLRTTLDTLQIGVLSTGVPSATGSVLINGQNISSASYGWGACLTVLDSSDYSVLYNRFYNYGNYASEAAAMADYINTISAGNITIINVYHDGRTNLSSALKQAIGTLGGSQINQLPQNAAYILIGKKGMSPGEAFEIKTAGGWDGVADTLYKDTLFFRQNDYGEMFTETAGPSNGWESIGFSGAVENDSLISVIPYGIKADGDVDTLSGISVNNLRADLSGIDHNVYPELRFKIGLKDGENARTKINKVAVDFEGFPELGTNLKYTGLETDSLFQGEDDARLTLRVFNGGFYDADSFSVNVNLVKANNESEVVFSERVGGLKRGASRVFETSYSSLEIPGSNKFVVSVDPYNSVNEYFEDNNNLTLPFFVEKDTSTFLASADVALKIDGKEIIDGDYVSPSPVMNVEIDYQPFFPVSDTSAVRIMIDGKPLYRKEADSINYDSINNKITFTYKPDLEKGEHYINVVGDNIIDRVNNTPGLYKTFYVTDELSIIDAYNYPNPFSSDTWFTFRLTQEPDEVKIRIYTVAGRLIREIEPMETDLGLNFNSIKWDGRDEDGDLVANGVYLYIISTRSGDKTNRVTRKLAVVR